MAQFITPPLSAWQVPSEAIVTELIYKLHLSSAMPRLLFGGVREVVVLCSHCPCWQCDILVATMCFLFGQPVPARLEQYQLGPRKFFGAIFLTSKTWAPWHRRGTGGGYLKKNQSVSWKEKHTHTMHTPYNQRRKIKFSAALTNYCNNQLMADGRRGATKAHCWGCVVRCIIKLHKIIVVILKAYEVKREFFWCCVK